MAHVLLSIDYVVPIFVASKVNYARDIELRMYRLGIILTLGNKCEKIRKLITGFEFAY